VSQQTSHQPLAGRVALVTGASGGLGSAIARDLAAKGARLVLTARRTDVLDSLAVALRANGTEVITLPADMASRDEVIQLAQRAQETWGRIDILVNNAGIGEGRTFARTSPEDELAMIDINFSHAVLLTRLPVPAMLENGYGRIITISSVAGRIAVDPLYSGTKFALRGFSIALWRQLRGTGVAASCVCPGFIRTEMTKSLRGRVPMPGPDRIGRAVGSLAVRPRREVVVPGFYRVAIAISWLLPWGTDRVTGGMERKLRAHDARKAAQARRG
jgi:short-subunit dehydrogenase